MKDHRNKKLVFRTALFNQDNGIKGSTNYSKLISPGCKNVCGLLILLSLSKESTNNCDNYLNPFLPETEANITQLLNLNVILGGKPVYSLYKSYTIDDFLNEVATFDSVKSTVNDVYNNGLMGIEYYKKHRVFYVNLSRSEASASHIMRSIECQFLVNAPNTFSFDIKFFTIFNKQYDVDTQTGFMTESYDLE
jgi:hypothetical protein